MYTILIIFILLVAIFIGFTIYTRYPFGEGLFASIMAGVTGAGLAAIILLFVSIPLKKNPDNLVTTHKITEIKKLNTSSETQGVFFLIAGGTDEELKYRFLVENKDGLLEYGTVSARDIKINYKDLKDGESPYFDVVTTKMKPEISRWVIDTKHKSECILHINENMILFDYNIDLN